MAVTHAPSQSVWAEPNDGPALQSAIAQQQLEPAILAHEQRTALLARELATLHGVDPDRAELAALVHDIADHYSEVDLAILAERFNIPVSYAQSQVPKLLHGAVGAERLRREFGVRDEELLDAVRDHVTGGPHMGQLAKIVFIADKIEPGRDRFTNKLDGIREEARQDLDRAMLRLYGSQLVDLVARGLPVEERTVTARNGLLAKFRTLTGLPS